MKKLISILLIGTAMAMFIPPACGRKGPDAPPDTSPPTVTSTSPQYGEQDVPINTSIAVVFSEEMNASTINSQTLFLTRSGSAVSGSVTCSGKTAVFTPDANLSPNSAHTLTVSVSVQDVAGNAMVAPYFCTFTTGTRMASGSYTVTPSAGPNGSISPNSPQQATYNSTVTFTVTPDAGYAISSVTGCGGTLAGNTYTTAPITGNCSVTASFSSGASTTHIITASAAANGSIRPSGSIIVNQGASQTFTISPNSGYHIADVLADGVSAGPVANYTFNNVTKDHALGASFAANTFTITAIAGEGGKISCTPSTVSYGSSSVCKISHDDNYRISDVLVDGISVGHVSSYTFRNVTDDHTIRASFRKR